MKGKNFWNYFFYDEKRNIKCLLCSYTFISENNTCVLLRHLRMQHKLYETKINDNGKIILIFIYIILFFFSKKKQTKKIYIYSNS